jgi:putative DNA primase/helicase
MDKMFEPLTAEEKATQAKLDNSKDKGIAIIPIPHDVELIIPSHPLGTPHIVWDYRDKKGSLLFRTCRFIIPQNDGTIKKEDRPLSFRQYKNGQKRWAWAGLDKPRPLYGLDRLAEKPEATVIICEGEKATDTATKLFPDYAAMTSPNGAGSSHCADWKPLTGRTIIIWRDNDPEGETYAQSVARAVKRIGCKSVSIVTIPEDFPIKWDLADALPEGWTEEQIINLLDDAIPVIDPLENLIERCRQNIGEAYKPEVLSALLSLKKEDLPRFMTLRGQLKNAGIGITMLDEALQSHAQENGELGIDPDHLDFARDVVSVIGSENILSTDTHVWKWDNQGVWKSLPDRAIKQDVQSILAESHDGITKGLVDSVADVLKTEIYAKEHEWNKNIAAVNVQNGELSWNGSEWVLYPHCREHFRTTQIPVVYDPQADCPRFRQFLDEVFQPDDDKEQKAQALLEMMGYSLMSHARNERFALLVGSGANGKSVVLEVIKVLLGKQNVCAVQPSQFGHKFQRAHLHMKLANLVTEIPEGAEIADAELKSIVSGELTTAEHKNQNPFDFCPYATCWFGTNHMPHTRDFSDALFRRAMVIPFNRKFVAGVDADPQLKDKLTEELSGILNLSLTAFSSVIRTGNFTEPQSCKDAKQEWRLEADQVAQFTNDKCVMESLREVSSQALYKEYEDWAEESGITRKLGRKNFTSRLVRLGCTLGKGTGGKRMVHGIRIGWKTER